MPSGTHSQMRIPCLPDRLALHACVRVSWVIGRFTDGFTPTQRRLNKETRKRAAEYLAHKREM